MECGGLNMIGRAIKFKLMGVAVMFVVCDFSLATEKSFSAVVFSENSSKIFAGIREIIEFKSPTLMKKRKSTLLELDVATGRGSFWSLPPGIQNREIIALVPSAAGIFVITQMTPDQDGLIKVHLFNSRKKIWKKIGQLDCSTPEKISTHSNKAKELVFSCVVESAERVSVEKSFSTNGISLRPGLVIRLPQESQKISGKMVVLEGDSYRWRQLRTTQGHEEKSYNIENLMRK